MVDQSTKQLLKYLHGLGVRLWVDEGKLRSKAPKGALTDALRSQIGTHKDALITLLSTANQTNQSAQSVIQRAARTGPIPLSFVQQSLWLLEQIETESAAYHEIGAIRIEGLLQVEAFEQALAEIVKRHEALRTTFTANPEGEPIQIINAPSFSLSIGELNQLLLEQIDQAIERVIREEAQSAFDLERDLPFRAKLFYIQNCADNLVSLPEPPYLLVIAMHHLVSDVWSMGLLFQELSTLYSAFVADKPSPLPPLPIQYADYAIWQREVISPDVLEIQLAYWKEHLANAPTLLQLSTDYPRPPRQTFQGGTVEFTISRACTQQLKILARQTDATLFMVLLAAFNTLLFRYSRQEDIVIGSPIANRQQSEVEPLIGFFVNTIVFRTLLHEDPTFEDLVRQVKEVAQNTYTHQDVSFDRVVSAIQLERNLSYSPLFQVMFAFQNIPNLRQLELPGLTMTPVKLDLGISKYDLSLDLYDSAGGMLGLFEYNTDIFNRATIERMVGHFQILLQGIVENSEQSISELPLLTETERHQILVKWNDTQTDHPSNKSIHQLFEEQVERTPNAIAVVFGDKQLTYQELNLRSNQLAHYLLLLRDENGPLLEPNAETRVGICMERSLDLIVGVLAILKAGGAYVPLDITYPTKRLAYMLADSQAPLLLTQTKFADQFASHAVQTVCLDEIVTHIAQQATSNPEHSSINADCLAYVIYTSGSTGQPKGVMIEHQALAKHALNVAGVYGITPKDNILQFSAFSFDAAQEQIFEALCNGTTLVLREDMIWTAEEFTQKIVEHSITLVELTPTYFQGLITLWKQERPSFLDGALRLIQTSSEVILPETVRQWQQLCPATRLLNIYGPTEATVTATGFELTDYRPEVWPINLSIGRPFPGRTAYILDPNLQPVPVGVYGELYLGGDSVGRGYLNRPELTAERFIDNPFCSLSSSGQPPDKLYKTGDVVRWIQNPDDCPESPPNIEFVGRVDEQVKLRGLRIELGEIEYALTEHPRIDYALVLLHEVTSEDKRLVAYVVPKGENSETKAWSDAPATLRDYLGQKLPTYMLPNAFMIIDHFPLMPNGKIDRNALPAPGLSALAISSEYIPPQTATEKTLAMLFESILKVENVGVHDDFFALGGHSLLLTQLFFQLRENFQAECSLQDLFVMPTIVQLANFIDSEQQEKPNRQRLDLNTEAILDSTIRPTQTISSQMIAQQESMYRKPSSIFLTGATGFLGAFLLYELLVQTQANIFCLVRSMDEQDGMSRLQNNLEQYGLWQEAYRERVNAISGDLSLPLFGLEVGHFNALASRIDAIYHNGAAVNFIKPYSNLKSINVLGTQEIIRLAAYPDLPIPIHYVSTLSVFDKIDYFDGRYLYEEDDLGDDKNLLNGYAQSKWVADKLIIEAQRRGIPSTIYRPGTISGHSQTGICNIDDFFSRSLKGSIQLSAWPQIGLDYYIAPVDYISSAIVTLSLQSANQNRIFHLENPHPVQYQQFAQWLNDFGYSVQNMSLDTWLSKLAETASGSSDNALTPLIPMFVTEGADATQPSMIDLLKNGRSPQFDCSNTLAGLAHTDITCPRVDAKLFQTYLSYFIQTGFLEAPSSASSNKHVVI